MKNLKLNKTSLKIISLFENSSLGWGIFITIGIVVSVAVFLCPHTKDIKMWTALVIGLIWLCYLYLLSLFFAKVKDEILKAKIFETVIDNVQNGIVMVSKDKGFQIWNKAAQNITGVNALEIPLSRWPAKFQLYKKEDLTSLIEAKDMPSARALNGETVQNEILIFHNGKESGKAVYLEINAVPIFISPEKQYGAIVTFTDVTNRYLLEEEKQKTQFTGRLAALEEISGNLAHEINTPLSIMRIALDQLAKKNGQMSPESFNENIEMISRSIDRVSKIIKVFKRYSSNGRQSQIQFFNLEDVINDAIELCEFDYKFKSIEIIKDLPLQPVICETFPSLITQALLNLLSNSRDALDGMDEKKIFIKAEVLETNIQITFSDNGPGVAEDVASRIFEPFFSTKSEASGIGLGISKDCMRKINGDLIYKKLNDHSSFILTFTQYFKTIDDSSRIEK